MRIYLPVLSRFAKAHNDHNAKELRDCIRTHGPLKNSGLKHSKRPVAAKEGPFFGFARRFGQGYQDWRKGVTFMHLSGYA